MPPYCKEDASSSPLFDAARKVQVKRLKQLLMESVTEDSVRARDSHGRTVLHFASGTSSCQSAELLVEAGAELECKDEDGYTPLHMAAGYGREDTVRFLLGRGANPLAEDSLGRTPRELAQEIVSRGLPNQGGMKVPRGQMEAVVAALLEAEEKWREVELPPTAPLPSDVSPKRTSGNTLIAAASKGDLEAVRACLDLLLKSKKRQSDVNTALSSASRNGHVEVAAFLLEQGAEVDAYDPDGATPLLAAADGGSAKCVDLLMQHGASVDAKDRVGVSALIAASYNGHVECLRSLVRCHADVNAQSHGGVTPLIAAAEGGSESCVRLLIEAGGDLEARTAEGKTALMHAVGQNISAAVEALIAAGADPDGSDNEGRTALHHGARKESTESLKLLLKAGANAARRCHRGRTPLDEAPPQSEVAVLLLARWKELEVEAAQKQARLLDELQETSGLQSECAESKSARKKRVKKARHRKRRSAEAGKPGLQGVHADSSTGGVERLSEGESEQSGIASDGEEQTLESPSSPQQAGTTIEGAKINVNAFHLHEAIGVEEETGLESSCLAPEVPEGITSVAKHSSDPMGRRSADDLEIDSLSECEGGDWVTVKSHRARKQTSQAVLAGTPQRQKKGANDGKARVSGAPSQHQRNRSAPAKEGLIERGKASGQNGEVASFVSKQTVCLESSRDVNEEQEDVQEMACRLRQESAELDGNRAGIEGREKLLDEREGEAEGQVKTVHRSRENPWLVSRETTSNGADGGVQAPLTSPQDWQGKGFGSEANKSAAAYELLRQREQELLIATQEIERLQGVLTALKEAHREEIRQTHAAAMAAAAASWRAWIGQKASEPSPNPAARLVGAELFVGGSVLTRTSSSGRPPPALRSDQTASVAALPPLPLLRPRQGSPGLSTEVTNGRPKWLEDAAAAAAVAAAAVMREKAFAQQWGRARTHTRVSVLADELLPTESAPARVSSSSEFDTQSESGSSSARSEASFAGGFKRPSPPLGPAKSPPPPHEHLSGIRRGLPAVSSPPGSFFSQGAPMPPVAFPLPTPRSHMESQWVFDPTRGSMIPTSSGPSMSSVEELFDQAPRLGLRATLARSRAYSSSNDLAALSRASGGHVLSATSLAEEADGSKPPPYTIYSNPPSTQRKVEKGSQLEEAPFEGPALRRFGSGLRTLSGMTRSASESFLSALVGDGSVATHALLPFASQTPAGKAEGWFSLVPSPSETAVKAAIGSQRTVVT